MEFIRAILGDLVRALALLARVGDLLKGLGEIARAVWRILRHLVSLEPLPAAKREDCCVEMPDVYKRPDPLLYAQYYLMKMGLSVTWDNPDIELFEPDPSAPEGLGTPVPSWDLKQGHDYKVRVRVWNGSYDAPAAGLPVHLSYLTFGVGTISTDIPPSKQVDLGVKGSLHEPAFAIFDWRTPGEVGHYCLQARLEWLDDANPDNNLGQENVNVGVAASPAEFAMQFRNDRFVRRQFILEADGYRLSEPRPCEEKEAERGDRDDRPQSRLAESRARWAEALREQGYGGSPLPADWRLLVTPSELALDQGEEGTINVSVEPASLRPGEEAAINVHAFAIERDERELVGGATFFVKGS